MYDLKRNRSIFYNYILLLRKKNISASQINIFKSNKNKNKKQKKKPPQCRALQDNSSIAATAESTVYNVTVPVAKATAQPATETDILRHTCDFIIYKLQRGKPSYHGSLETSVLIMPAYLL